MQKLLAHRIQVHHRNLVARLWRKARDVIGTRRRFFEELRTITRYLVFADWGALIRTMITGEPPPQPQTR